MVLFAKSTKNKQLDIIAQKLSDLYSETCHALAIQPSKPIIKGIKKSVYKKDKKRSRQDPRTGKTEKTHWHKLKLQKCKMNDLHFQALTVLCKPELQNEELMIWNELDFSGNMLTENIIDPLKYIFSNNKTLTIIDLSANKITDDGKKKIQDSISECDNYKIYLRISSDIMTNQSSSITMTETDANTLTESTIDEKTVPLSPSPVKNKDFKFQQSPHEQKPSKTEEKGKKKSSFPSAAIKVVGRTVEYTEPTPKNEAVKPETPQQQMQSPQNQQLQSKIDNVYPSPGNPNISIRMEIEPDLQKSTKNNALIQSFQVESEEDEEEEKNQVPKPSIEKAPPKKNEDFEYFDEIDEPEAEEIEEDEEEEEEEEDMEASNLIENENLEKQIDIQTPSLPIDKLVEPKQEENTNKINNVEEEEGEFEDEDEQPEIVNKEKPENTPESKEETKKPEEDVKKPSSEHKKRSESTHTKRSEVLDTNLQNKRNSTTISPHVHHKHSSAISSGSSSRKSSASPKTRAISPKKRGISPKFRNLGVANTKKSPNRHRTEQSSGNKGKIVIPTQNSNLLLNINNLGSPNIGSAESSARDSLVSPKSSSRSINSNNYGTPPKLLPVAKTRTTSSPKRSPSSPKNRNSVAMVKNGNLNVNHPKLSKSNSASALPLQIPSKKIVESQKENENASVKNSNVMNNFEMDNSYDEFALEGNSVEETQITTNRGENAEISSKIEHPSPITDNSLKIDDSLFISQMAKSRASKADDQNEKLMILTADPPSINIKPNPKFDIQMASAFEAENLPISALETQNNDDKVNTRKAGPKKPEFYKKTDVKYETFLTTFQNRNKSHLMVMDTDVLLQSAAASSKKEQKYQSSGMTSTRSTVNSTATSTAREIGLDKTRTHLLNTPKANSSPSLLTPRTSFMMEAIGSFYKPETLQLAPFIDYRMSMENKWSNPLTKDTLHATIFKQYGTFEHLRHLCLSKNRIGVIDVGVLPKQLTILDLTSNKLSSIGHAFKHLPNLQYLSLRDNEISEILPGELTTNTTLVEIDLSLNNLTSVSGLESLSNLEIVDFSYNHLTKYEDVRILSLNKTLQTVSFIGNPIADDDKTAKNLKLILTSLCKNLREYNNAKIHRFSQQERKRIMLEKKLRFLEALEKEKMKIKNSHPYLDMQKQNGPINTRNPLKKSTEFNKIPNISKYRGDLSPPYSYSSSSGLNSITRATNNQKAGSGATGNELNIPKLNFNSAANVLFRNSASSTLSTAKSPNNNQNNVIILGNAEMMSARKSSDECDELNSPEVRKDSKDDKIVEIKKKKTVKEKKMEEKSARSTKSEHSTGKRSEREKKKLEKKEKEIEKSEEKDAAEEWDELVPLPDDYELKEMEQKSKNMSPNDENSAAPKQIGEPNLEKEEKPASENQESSKPNKKHKSVDKIAEEAVKIMTDLFNFMKTNYPKSNSSKKRDSSPQFSEFIKELQSKQQDLEMESNIFISSSKNNQKPSLNLEQLSLLFEDFSANIMSFVAFSKMVKSNARGSELLSFKSLLDECEMLEYDEKYNSNDKDDAIVIDLNQRGNTAKKLLLQLVNCFVEN